MGTPSPDEVVCGNADDIGTLLAAGSGGTPEAGRAPNGSPQ